MNRKVMAKIIASEVRLGRLSEAAVLLEADDGVSAVDLLVMLFHFLFQLL